MDLNPNLTRAGFSAKGFHYSSYVSNYEAFRHIFFVYIFSYSLAIVRPGTMQFKCISRRMNIIVPCGAMIQR